MDKQAKYQLVGILANAMKAISDLEALTWGKDAGDEREKEREANLPVLKRALDAHAALGEYRYVLEDELNGNDNE